MGQGWGANMGQGGGGVIWGRGLIWGGGGVIWGRGGAEKSTQ